VLHLLVLSLDLGGRLHALDIGRLDNDGLGLFALLGLLADIAELVLSQSANATGASGFLGVT
jgi:hypothetical protein